MKHNSTLQNAHTLPETNKTDPNSKHFPCDFNTPTDVTHLIGNTTISKSRIPSQTGRNQAQQQQHKFSV